MAKLWRSPSPKTSQVLQILLELIIGIYSSMFRISMFALWSIALKWILYFFSKNLFSKYEYRIRNAEHRWINF